MTDSIPRWAREGRGHWHNTGTQRPPFALEPGPGQESVWDYPRPPRLEPDPREIIILWQGRIVARTTGAFRVLETASPPTFYLPPEDIETEFLRSVPGASRCEWKGEARYWSVTVEGEELSRVAWSYPDPFPEFAAIRDFIAFYPEPLVCTVGGERVTRQPGGFYGGWITPEVVGPFKGEPGTGGW